MNSTKANRISQIEDEVNELHPLLDRLLRSLPGINHVEYTHGPNEMGADFVMEKTHEQLNQNRYVAVIAKTDKILQDYSAIQRQIEECAVDRPVANGKRVIIIDEVWVITTKTISENAKRKINAEFKQRNIIFIKGDELAALVEKYIPDYWLQIDVALGEYLTKIKEQFIVTDRRLDIVSTGTDSFFVSPDIVKVANNPYTQGQNRRKGRRHNHEKVVLDKK